MWVWQATEERIMAIQRISLAGSDGFMGAMRRLAEPDN